MGKVKGVKSVTCVKGSTRQRLENWGKMVRHLPILLQKKYDPNEKMFVLVVLLIFNRKSPAVERRLREA